MIKIDDKIVSREIFEKFFVRERKYNFISTVSFPSVINEYLKAKIEATYSKFLFYKAVDKLE